uniref:Uncharacterized protein n=1 Tax=Anguilla anguilla TaxID=7936 RepID=A0A0E9VUU2_ANGAN
MTDTVQKYVISDEKHLQRNTYRPLSIRYYLESGPDIESVDTGIVLGCMK